MVTIDEYVNRSASPLDKVQARLAYAVSRAAQQGDLDEIEVQFPNGDFVLLQAGFKDFAKVKGHAAPPIEISELSELPAHQDRHWTALVEPFITEESQDVAGVSVSKCREWLTSHGIAQD